MTKWSIILFVQFFLLSEILKLVTAVLMRQVSRKAMANFQFFQQKLGEIRSVLRRDSRNQRFFHFIFPDMPEPKPTVVPGNP